METCALAGDTTEAKALLDGRLHRTEPVSRGSGRRNMEGFSGLTPALCLAFGCGGVQPPQPIQQSSRIESMPLSAA